jgi:putative protease
MDDSNRLPALKAAAMKVTAPIADLKELEPLAKSGAEELYCGVTPRVWIEKFSPAVWANRRGPSGGNIFDLSGLRQLVAEAHKLGLPVYLTLNAQYHTQEQMGVLRDLVRAAVEEAQVDSLIIGDLGMMLAVRELYPGYRFMASTIGVGGNRETVALYRDLGARRIIFPRHLSIPEMESLMAAAPELEYEAFVLNDACVFEEGYCHTQHNVQGLTAFCFTDWEYQVHPAGGRVTLDPAEEERWGEHVRDHREWLWYAQNCGSTLNQKGLPNGHCGLCAIPELARIGIASLKVVGREAGMFRKVRSVQLVRAVVEAVRAGAGRREACELAIRARGDPATCASGYMCYYREVQDYLRGEGAPHPAEGMLDAAARAGGGPAAPGAPAVGPGGGKATRGDAQSG